MRNTWNIRNTRAAKCMLAVPFAKPIQITVDETEYTIEASTTAAELVALVHPEVDPSAPGYWLLGRADGSKWVENPQRKNSLVADLFEDGEPVPLYLEQPPKCRHGSPAVRNQGFLCGWC